jgi:hypothetical protein
LQSEALTRRQTDRLLLVAVAIGAVMFVGFAKNYYLRAWLGTRPIGALVHVHGAVMTGWVALFLTQTLLVSARRVDLHRKLGIAGAALAAIVVALGVYTIAASAARQHLRIRALSLQLLSWHSTVSACCCSALSSALRCWRGSIPPPTSD